MFVLNVCRQQRIALEPLLVKFPVCYVIMEFFLNRTEFSGN